MSKSRSGQRGFVLVLTLWVLVIVTIAAAYFAERVERSVELARQSGQNIRAVIDMDSTRAEMLYRLGVTSITMDGLGLGADALVLDDRTYQGLGDTLVRLQDDRGLINLNMVDDARLYNFLGLMGIPADQRGHLADTLHDYTDADNFRRLNGAEAEDYLALGLPPPTNQNLVTPWEIRRIIGWRDYPGLWEKIARLSTTSLSVGINPNTAPAEVLATLPGITEDTARLIVVQRQQSPLMGVDQLATIAATPAEQYGMQIIALPSNAVRITQGIKGLPWAIQYNVTLTPNGNDGPWRIDYYSRIGAEMKGEAKKLTPRSSAPPGQIPAFLSGS